MTRSEQYRCSGFTRLAGIAGLLILLVTAIAAPAQTFTVLHDFTGSDGGNPGREAHLRPQPDFRSLPAAGFV